MENLIKEIEKFIKYSLYSESSKSHFKFALPHFLKELSKMTNTKMEDIHLQKIYEDYDSSGNFLKFDQIDEDLMDEFFYSNLGKGYSWLKEQRDALSALFKYLNRNYEFNNVMTEITFDLKKYKPKYKIVNCLSKHELLKFFHYLVSYSTNLNRDVLLFTLLITTGCRMSEITNIKLKDIYWDDNMIFLPKTKHRQSRTLPLRIGITDSIRVYCELNKLSENQNLFPLSRYEIKKIFYEFLAKAGLPKVTIHSLRHSFATFMSESGTDISIVQQLLGHSDLFTTKGYVHTNEIKNRHIKIHENDEIYAKLVEFE